MPKLSINGISLVSYCSKQEKIGKLLLLKYI